MQRQLERTSYLLALCFIMEHRKNCCTGFITTSDYSLSPLRKRATDITNNPQQNYIFSKTFSIGTDGRQKHSHRRIEISSRMFSLYSAVESNQNHPSSRQDKTSRKKVADRKSLKVSRCIVLVGSAGIMLLTTGRMRSIGAIVCSYLLANTSCNTLMTKITIRSKCINQTSAFNDICESRIWEGNKRISNASKQSRRRNAWMDQCLTSVEETEERMADLKEKEAMTIEAEQKEKAKKWVQATIRSSTEAREELNQTCSIRAEKKRISKRWAESMVRSTGVDL
uniref:Uncharacterized protein n=1 Tax=Chaetoceros debilis TaxID=122233 RepID=A0A7S3PY62_9STRA